MGGPAMCKSGLVGNVATTQGLPTDSHAAGVGVAHQCVRTRSLSIACDCTRCLFLGKEMVSWRVRRRTAWLSLYFGPWQAASKSHRRGQTA